MRSRISNWRRIPTRILAAAPFAATGCILLSALGAGCAIPAPSVRADTPHGPVLAESAEEAARGAAWLREFHPRLRALLPGTSQRPVEVWLQREFGLQRFQTLPQSMAGFINETSGRIYLRASSECVEQTLCHELVHALLDDSWSTLPAILEEGLCELVSIEVVGGCARRQRSQLLLGAAIYLQGNGEPVQAKLTVELRGLPGEAASRQPLYSADLTVSYESDFADPLPPLIALQQGGSTMEGGSASVELVPDHYGFGTWIAERLVERRGYAGLRELCLDARREGLALVRPEVLLGAAEVGDPSTWQLKVLRSLREDDLLRILLDRHGSLIREAASWLRDAGGAGASGEDILRRAHVKFGFPAAGVGIAPLEDDGFRGALLAALGENRAAAPSPSR